MHGDGVEGASDRGAVAGAAAERVDIIDDAGAAPGELVIGVARLELGRYLVARVEIMVEKVRDDLETDVARIDLDNDKISKLSKIIDKYKLASKSSRDWVKCNQLISELETEI